MTRCSILKVTSNAGLIRGEPMTMFYRCALCIVLLFTLLVLIDSPVYAQCVVGDVSAEFQIDGPFAGQYKYTLNFTWDLPQGLSNVTLDCKMNCALACQLTWGFDDPSGFSDGVNGAPCVVDYVGEFNCNGNPSIGLMVPIIKWDTVEAVGCEPGATGSGTLWFYTIAAPFQNGPTPIFLLKNGLQVCEGTVSGVCPAICTNPVEESTWGAVKEKYGDEQ